MPRRLLTAIAPLAMLAIAACTTPFRADVARFQQMPAPQGESFYIQPADEEKSGSLEFATYANLVALELGAYGYDPAPTPQDATLVVSMQYSVDNGRERIVTSPGFHNGFWGSRSLFYRRWGWRSPYYYGWYDPFFDSGFGRPNIRSYTLYTSQLELRIERTENGESVFEGRARARSRNNALTELVPNLVEAMFTGFPGNSGEEVRITVMPREDG